MPSYDTTYKRYSARNLSRGPRKPWRAYYYANNQRTYLGNFATRAEAVEREYTEKLRHQRELLEDYPDDIRLTRQQRLI